MSTLRFSCPQCRAVFPVANVQRGQRVVCPNCNSRLKVPEAVPTPPVWYCGRDEQKFGPFSWAQLKQLVSRSQLQPTDFLWRDGMPEWEVAGSVRGLFPDAAPESPLAPEPPPAPAPEPARQAPGDSEDIFDEPFAPPEDERLGPLSLKGIRVRPQRSLTLGDFRILQKLGAGGMGAVYLAKQRSRDRLVALKVLSRHLTAQPTYVQRFYREAEVLASLDHPNIVSWYGVGEERGFPYFAMEFIDGFSTVTLQQHFGDKLPVGDALHIVLKCAEALRYAHEQGIVHRDVKPENILITRLGHVKITDLGLAKPSGEEDLSLTASGVGLGTPTYMAPEQARDAKHADHRCDLYALGGVLYYFLTGQPPFQAKTAMELLLIKEQGRFPSPRKRNAEVPPRLELIIDKMLARDLKYRYRNCTELIGDLESLALANAHLSFNPLRVGHAAALAQELTPSELVEILLIHDDLSDILLAQDALAGRGVHSNLNVVGDGQEALAFLRREGKYVAARRPNLIILGRDLLTVGSQTVLEEIKANDALRAIPLMVLTTAAGAADILGAHGLQASLAVPRPENTKQFEQVIELAHNLCLTLVELPLPR